MFRAVIVFGSAVVLSLLFHLALGGDSSIKYQNFVVKISLVDLVLGLLLLSNLLCIIYIARRK